MKLFIKPFSVNQAWKGQKYKTDKYKSFEELALWTLPGNLEIPKGPLLVVFKFGFRNSGSDADNPVKPFLDVLQKKYGFNDSQVYQVVSTKTIVKKGEKEFIQFDVFSFEEYKMSLTKKLPDEN